MRVLLTADPELPVPPKLYGGIERIVASLAGDYRARGHQVALAAHAESTCEVDEFHPWPGLASQSRWDTMRNSARLLKAVRSFQPDILHSFSRLAILGPLLPTPLPKAMSYQRNPSLRTTRWARRISRGTLAFTGCSEHICRIGRRAGGDWTAIPNFVDLAKFRFVPRVPDDAPLVFLSRIEPIKGAHLAIEAARRSGRRLLIAGNFSESGREGAYWREAIKPRIDGKQIEYVGTVDDRAKDELLGSAAAMIVPIQWDEPFGIVFAEAMACGTPVISCPRGAVPEIVDDGVHGAHCANGRQLLRAIDAIPKFDRRACRRRVEERFSLDVVAGQYLRYYASRAGGGCG